MLDRFSASLAEAGRRAALGSGAVLLMAAGVGFLTAALWMGLALAGGAILASTVLGAGYLGLGLIGLALAGRHPEGPAGATRPGGPNDAPPPPSPPREATAETLLAAFLGGLTAGTRARGTDR
jgi:hypothetical protein